MSGEMQGLYALATVLEQFSGESSADVFEGGVGIDCLRSDVCGECLTREELLDPALRGDGYFHVPRTVEAEA